MATRKKIDDFGERIPGAAKHRTAPILWGETLAHARDVDLESGPCTLAELWPRPKWGDLIKDGMDPDGVAAARSMRDLWAAKPRGYYGKSTWGELTKQAAQLSHKVASEGVTPENEALIDDMAKLAKGKLDYYGDTGYLEQWREHSTFYRKAGHDKSFSGLRLGTKAKWGPCYSLHNYPHSHGRGYIVRGAGINKLPRDLWDSHDSLDGLIDAVVNAVQKGVSKDLAKKTEKSVNELARTLIGGFYSGRGLDKHTLALTKDSVCFLGCKVRGGDPIPLYLFDDTKEMWEFYAKHQPELVQKALAVRSAPHHRVKRNLAGRIGPTHGVDEINEEFMQRTFNPRGVQFGNTMPQKERAAHMQLSYEAIMDLCMIMGMSPEQAFLKGDLALAYGARGRGGRDPAAAHYESGQRVINLTRGNGAGTLAHEWFHALDHSAGSGELYGTELPSAAQSKGFRMLNETISALPYRERCFTMNARFPRSGRDKKIYWQSMIEMAARAFEVFVIERLNAAGCRNEYLAQVTAPGQWLEHETAGMPERPCGTKGADKPRQSPTLVSYPYPTPDENRRLDKCFTQIIRDVIGVEPPTIRALEEQALKRHLHEQAGMEAYRGDLRENAPQSIGSEDPAPVKNGHGVKSPEHQYDFFGR